MWPILLAPPTFPIVVETYPVLLLIAVLSGVAMALGLAHRRMGTPRLRMAVAVVTLAFTSLVGARVHFVLANEAVLAPGALFAPLFNGGFHAGGAVIAAAAMSLLVTRALRLPFGDFVDCLAPAAALGMVVHRVACLLRGCCLGALCTFPWCVSYPRDSFAFLLHAHGGVIAHSATRSAPVHPLPLYYIGLCLVVLIFSLWWYRRRRYPGEVALLALLINSLGSWYLERFRAITVETVFVGSWPQLTLVRAVLTAATFALLALAEVRFRTRMSVTRPDRAGR